MAKLVSKGRELNLKSTQVMGILNVTPDSFSDGGHYVYMDSALRRVEAIQKEGAVIVDVGGESTRPGASPVGTQEELDRVLPVVEAICRNSDLWVSVDTSNPEVMSAVAELGVHILNDVRGFSREGSLQVAASSGLALCMMHMQGEPSQMQQAPHYDHVVEEVYYYLAKRIQAASESGITTDRLMLDPGFGFGKTLDHNLELLAKLERFHTLGAPLLVGLSRKSMIGALLGDAPVEDRLYGSLSAAVISALKGVKIVRVHDVKATVDALKIVAGVKSWD